MSTVLALIVVAAFGYLIYRFLPNRAERAFRLDRYYPNVPVSEQNESYYEQRRRYSDLAAVYGRGDVPDPE